MTDDTKLVVGKWVSGLTLAGVVGLVGVVLSMRTELTEVRIRMEGSVTAAEVVATLQGVVVAEQQELRERVSVIEATRFTAEEARALIAEVQLLGLRIMERTGRQ